VTNGAEVVTIGIEVVTYFLCCQRKQTT